MLKGKGVTSQGRQSQETTWLVAYMLASVWVAPNRQRGLGKVRSCLDFSLSFFFFSVISESVKGKGLSQGLGWEFYKKV